MAKQKSEGDIKQPKQGKYNPADVAEFVMALEDNQEVEESTPVMEDLSSGRKIKVKSENPSIAQRRQRLSTSDSSAITEALTTPEGQDMKHLTKSKRKWPWGWTMGIVALLAVVSVAGFFFFNQTKRFANANVLLSFKPIVTIISGSNMTVTLDFQNLEPVDLTNVQLTVEYPEGFTYISSQPSTSSQYKNDFSLGTVRTGQTGQVIITGTLIGAVGVTRDFSATMSYRPANFNSDFQQHTKTQATITSSILGLALSGPTQLAPGANGSWTVTYTNTSDRDLKDVNISATYPDGFTLTSVKPTAQDRSAVWKFGTLKKGVTGKITINGKVEGAVGDTLPMKVTAGLQTSTNTVDVQDEQSLLIILVKTGVTTTVAVNGSTDPLVIEPGETLTYSVRVVNTSDIELTNATVSVHLDGAALDLTKLANDSQGLVKDSTLSWSKEQLAALANLKPNQSVTINFSVGTNSLVTVVDDADRDPKITATISVSAPALISSTNTATQPSTIVVTKISTVMSLKAEARYYSLDGTTLGSGPLPPKVATTTSYRVQWTITNSTSDASNLVVSARLPNTTLWTGKNLSRDAGELAFDPDSRLVRWTLNTVPAGVGGRLAALTASFDLSITPTADQVGSIPILIETATATATDSWSGKTITIPTATLTTELLNDTKAVGQGAVVI